jgi:DNA topoisomerase-1
MAAPRALDEDLIDAYRARRALDYLVGLHAFAGAVAQAAGRQVGGRVQSVRCA